MLRESLRQDSLVLEAGLIEELTACPEAPVSAAPAYCPQAIGIALLSPKEPKEPRKPRCQ
ncbi:hypothetical protein [Streptomyces hawaiiensis]|uniref:Uncharacterized protein n=1 Tax=Streptomyces hawaiiensis TaxID=67305 RepID=A0A6G5R655_9ACTN|nr:hypothetical protein [Streptomyces hawaiiensis]QCD53525.1 hypothetical protein CEB94_00145 [Streptomyces hawaiiensis]